MPMHAIPLSEQFVHLLASVVLLLSFAMLAQRRIRTLIHLFALQGAALVCSTLIVAWSSGQHHLYYSAALTLALKVIVLPVILYRLIDRLDLRWDTETGLRIPTTMLAGVVLVVFAFGLAQPISSLAGSVTQSTLGIAIVVGILIGIGVLQHRRPRGVGVIAWLDRQVHR